MKRAMTVLPVLAVSAGIGALLLYFTIDKGAYERVLALRVALAVAMACGIVYAALRGRRAAAPAEPHLLNRLSVEHIGKFVHIIIPDLIKLALAVVISKRIEPVIK